MNERIAKLYDQAIVIEDGGDYVCGELDPEKFAELIVRECAEMVRKNNYQFISNEQHYGVTSGDILNHFGVKDDCI